MAVIALIDGEHHPAAVRDALERLGRARELSGVVFCGGEEKLPDEPLEELYGQPVQERPQDALRRLAGHSDAVVDLADEPVLPPSAKLELAALALHLGLRYEAPGLALDPPRYEPVDFAGPKVAVIATGKRTGKTAVACHLAGLLSDDDPLIVCMGRGGPARPVVADPHTTLEDLIALAASLAPGIIIFEGSGSSIPPVQVDRTVYIVGPGEPEPLSGYGLLRADLVVAREDAVAPPGALRFHLRPEPAEPLPDAARVALFTTGAETCEGAEPVMVSTNLARRSALQADLVRAVAERCDVWLTELKAAAIDTVAMRARHEGVRVVFVRNRPVGDGLDEALVSLARDVARS